MSDRTTRRRVLCVTAPDGEPAAGPDMSWRADLVATEEPLEIRIDGSPLVVTMRTPGDDVDLAGGFLVGEGVVRAPADISQIRICGHRREGGQGQQAKGNVAGVSLAPHCVVGSGLHRNVPVSRKREPRASLPATSTRPGRPRPGQAPSGC